MKKNQLRFTFAAISAIFLLVWVLERSRAIYFKEHQVYSHSLSELRQEYALLNQNILKYRYQFSVPEEYLTKHFAALKRIQTELEKIPSYIDARGRRDLQSILQTNAKTIREKEKLIEPFTSQSAILQNSLDYVTVLIAQINSQEEVATRSLYSKARELLDNVLLYKFNGSEEIKQKIDVQIEHLSGFEFKDWPLIELALFHTEIIFTTKPKVDSITKQLLELPTQGVVQELEIAYNYHYQEANETVGYYQFYGYCVVLSIVSTMFYLAIRKLTKAHASALEADKIKLEFLANMSHEIRTPMNGVLGMTALLEATELDREQKEFVEIIQISAENLLYILNAILDLSKTDTEQIQIETVDFDLRTCVKNVLDLLSPQAQKKGLELIGWIDTKVPRKLHGSPGYIRQILLNLVSNAIKFTESGKVWVSVRVGISPSSTQKNNLELLPIHFSVTDTGIGIAPKDQEKLFRSFSQLNASTSRKYGGTGLGLSISKQLVELMGGKIGVKSELGIGSTFWFTLPFEVEAAKSISFQPKVSKSKI